MDKNMSTADKQRQQEQNRNAYLNALNDAVVAVRTAEIKEQFSRLLVVTPMK